MVILDLAQKKWCAARTVVNSHSVYSAEGNQRFAIDNKKRIDSHMVMDQADAPDSISLFGCTPQNSY